MTDIITAEIQEKIERSRSSPIYRPVLQHQVVVRIKQLIDDGTLVAGSRIPERWLCAQLGVSRTPMREAFRALEGEGLLEVRPRQGATIKKFKPEEIDHLFEVLEVLEALAGELACDAMTDAELAHTVRLHERMMKAFRQRDRRTFFRLNRQFHESIVRAARNPALMRIYEGLSGQTRRVRYMAGNTDTQWTLAAKEHEQIIAAIQARNGKALQRLLRVHLKHKRERVKARLTQ